LTPSGTLKQAVRKNDGYPYDEIHLFSDAHVPPGRSYKYLIDDEIELEALRSLMRVPDRDELAGEYAFAEEARSYRDKKGVMLTAPLNGVGDPLMWLSGVENTIYSAIDRPDFLNEYIEILSGWNMDWLRVMIDMGADMVLRRGWYESADFWSPSLYREFLLEPLRREVALAHEAGLKYAYVMNSGVMPLIDELKQTGIDLLTNTEPEKNDLALLKAKVGNQFSLCTGVNNYHVIEEGTEDDVEAAVKKRWKNCRRAAGLSSRQATASITPARSIAKGRNGSRKTFTK